MKVLPLLATLSVVLIGLITISALLPNLVVKHEVDGYVVLEVYNILTHGECDAIINVATKRGLSTSNVWSYGSDSGTSVNDEHRNSKTTWLPDGEHTVCMKLAKLSERLTGIPLSLIHI